MESQDEEEKIVNISKNDEFSKEYEGDREEDFSQEQPNPLDNPSVIHNYSQEQEEDLFQSQSRDQLNKEKNESSNFSFSLSLKNMNK